MAMVGLHIEQYVVHSQEKKYVQVPQCQFNIPRIMPIPSHIGFSRLGLASFGMDSGLVFSTQARLGSNVWPI